MARFIVFLDIETTGVNPYDDAIIQLSAIKFFGNKELDRLRSRIHKRLSSVCAWEILTSASADAVEISKSLLRRLE